MCVRVGCVCVCVYTVGVCEQAQSWSCQAAMLGP